VINASEVFNALTRLDAADFITEASVTVVADGVNVTGPPVADTVIVIPGKSLRPVKVFEFDVTVCRTLFLVYVIVAVPEPPPTIDVTVNGYGDAPDTAPPEEYAVATEESLLLTLAGTHDVDPVISSAASNTDSKLVFNA
jgi:hypothetical protein